MAQESLFFRVIEGQMSVSYTILHTYIFLAPPPVAIDNHDASFMNWHDLTTKKDIWVKKIYEAVWPLITIL